jgi:hypothetical protein
MPVDTQVRRTVLAAAVVGALALAGCSEARQSETGAQGESQPSAASGEEDGAVGGEATHFGNLALSVDTDPVIERDQSTWTLPLDRYSAVPSYRLEGLAEDLLRTDCIRRAGFPDEKTGFDYDAPRAETEGANWTRLFTVELAQKYGYRMAPDPGDNFAADREAGGGDWRTTKSDEYLNVWDRCTDEADTKVNGWKQTRIEAEDHAEWEQRHPGEPYPTTEEETAAWYEEQMDSMEQDAAEAAADPTNLNVWFVDTSVPRLQEAAARWRECMAPLGIIDLPSEPWDPDTRPPQSLQDRWGWESAGDAASADEIQVATHDAQCRRDSGWFDTLYDESWNQEEAFIAEHKAELDATDLAQNVEAAQRALQTIRGYLQSAQG